jgi:membrane protein DedA with SNARE-associated domain
MLESEAAARLDTQPGRAFTMTIPFSALLAVPVAAILDSLVDIIEWIVMLPVEIFRAYSSFLRWAADSVQSLFESYGYWVVFVGTLSENTLLVGLIVPGALVVLLAGLAAHDGTISWPQAMVLGVLGTIAGDTISYFLGRYGWSRFGRTRLLQELSEKAREPLLRRGTVFVLFYHFAGYTRVIGPATAGLLRMPYRKWALADYCGAVLWICAYFGIGYGLGVAGLTLDSTDHYFRYVEWAILILAGTWVYFLLRSHSEAIMQRLTAVDAGRSAQTEGVTEEETEPV